MWSWISSAVSSARFDVGAALSSSMTRTETPMKASRNAGRTASGASCGMISSSKIAW